MDSVRYKAFVSYSHVDEAWARWLHHGLETYRIPKRLVGRTGPHGPVPRHIAPIFRDRDELAAAPQLAEPIQEALQNSENLIVLCSPAAAKSNWVNEEVRQFRRTGRGDRIFCVIVDGDPSDESTTACFPPALFEGVADDAGEPLAVDVRDWADGKRLAKLKLIAGIVGVRLDELRRRDHQRRRRLKLATVVAISLAVVLIISAVLSRIAERHEREKAEQLAAFMVDLGERVKAVVDLETLSMITTEAYRVLEGIEPQQLTPETLVRVGLAIRQFGHVSEQQGRPEEALTAYRRSQQLFTDLYAMNPNDTDILFELSQAEFHVGAVYFRQGNFERAWEPWVAYEETTRKLTELVPNNPTYRIENMLALENLAAAQMEGNLGELESVVVSLEQVIDITESVMESMPPDNEVLSEYANLLAWYADAHRQMCSLDEALDARQRAVEIIEKVTQAEPSNNNLKQRLAYAYSGLSALDLARGELESAHANGVKAIDILARLLTADPSNVDLRSVLTRHRHHIAVIRGWIGQEEKALTTFQNMEVQLDSARGDSALGTIPRSQDLPQFFLDYANILYRTGEAADAKDRLRRSVLLKQENADPGSSSSVSLRWLGQARYTWRQLSENGFEEAFPDLTSVHRNGTRDAEDCRDIDALARLDVLEGRRPDAQEKVRILENKGYRHPAFVAFCRQEGLCES